MDCRHAADLMPWYLNGTLDAAERGQVEEHLESCDSCPAELRETEAGMILFGGHPPTNLLVDYVFERPGTPRDLVEAHLAGCEACADELAMVLESRGELERQRAPQRRTETPDPARVVPLRRPSEPRSHWRAAAMAAALIGLIGISSGLWGWRTLDRQRESFAKREHAAESRIAELEAEIRGLDRAWLNVPIHDLWPDDSLLRSAAAGPMELPTDDGPAATLILNSQLAADQQVERLEIRGGDGQVLQSLDGAVAGPSGSFTMSIALGRLPRGKLQILLFGPAEAEPIEVYSFELD